MIKQITIQDISPMRKEAERAGLVFCKSASLYGMFVNGRMVAFTGIVIYKNKAVFKNHYVQIEQRGKGYFKNMLDFSIGMAQHLKINIVEATCTKMSLRAYLDRGFKPIKQYKHYTKVRHENI